MLLDFILVVGGITVFVLLVHVVLPWLEDRRFEAIERYHRNRK